MKPKKWNGRTIWVGKKKKCKHDNDKIIHGVYCNYLACPDCGRTRGKKKAFTRPKGAKE